MYFTIPHHPYRPSGRVFGYSRAHLSWWYAASQPAWVTVRVRVVFF